MEQATNDSTKFIWNWQFEDSQGKEVDIFKLARTLRFNDDQAREIINMEVGDTLTLKSTWHQTKDEVTIIRTK